MSIIAFVSKWGVIAYFFTSLLPLSTSDHWFIRGWDFPRLQLLIFALLFALIFLFTFKGKKNSKIVFILCLIIGIGLDLYRILPYSGLWAKESIQTNPQNNGRSVSFISVNVLQKNKNPELLLKLIEEKSPDIVLLLEVNDRWIKDLAILEKTYAHHILNPLENTYGLALYSKLELEDAEVRELIEKDVPSIYTKVKLRSGEKIEIFGLHPRPPHYKTGDTTERDAELIHVAKTVAKAKLPVVVIGDLNDVAWSHTTRLFRRISQLLDPRVGRGSFPTFPAHIPLIGFPLDYVFHSDELTLVSIKRLDDIKSDHFPIFIELNLSPDLEVLQDGLPKDKSDKKEASEALDLVKKE